MKFLENIKKRQENRRIFNEMAKLAKEYKKKSKAINEMADSKEIDEVKIELTEIRNKVIELNNDYTYRFKSIDKQKKKEIKKCKSRLDELRLYKEFMEKSLKKYEKENTDFSKGKHERLKRKYDKLINDIHKLEKRMDIAKGIVQDENTESTIKIDESRKDRAAETDEEKILNDLFRSKQRLDEQIRLKELNVEKVRGRADYELFKSLEKDLEFLNKKRKNIEDNINLISGDDESEEENQA